MKEKFKKFWLEKSQLELFSTFYANVDQTQTLSIYDSIPKFLLTKTRANKTNEFRQIENLKVGKKKVNVTIIPAMIKTPQGVKTIFPGIREELIEKALRFMAVQQNINLFLNQKLHQEKEYNSVAISFTLSSLRKQLSKDGHNFKLNELREGLEVMHGCDLRVEIELDDRNLIRFRGPLLELNIEVDPIGKNKNKNLYVGSFHQIATQAILNKEYYLMNYRRLIRLSQPLARWIANLVNERFRQASKKRWLDGKNGGYRLTLNSVLKGSGIVIEKRLRDNVNRIRDALKELREEGFLDTMKPFEENPTFQAIKGRPKLIDIEWLLYPSLEFSEEIIQGNIECKKRISKNQGLLLLDQKNI